jgi:hypothetical protein
MISLRSFFSPVCFVFSPALLEKCDGKNELKPPNKETDLNSKFHLLVALGWVK